MSEAFFDKPRASAPGDVGSEGTGTAKARHDHVHDRSTESASGTTRFWWDPLVLTSATATMNLTFVPLLNSLHVYLGGGFLLENTHYTLSSNQVTVLSAAGALTNDILTCRYAYDRSTITGYPAAVLADSPLAYWRCDDAPTAQLLDFSGNGHNAQSFTGSNTRQVTSLLPTDTNKATQITSAPGYFTIPDSNAWDTSALTVELWTNHGGSGGIALFQHDNRIRFENSSGVGKVFVGTGTSTLIGQTDSNFTNGAGNKQIGFTYTSTELKFYKNGVQYGSTVTHATALPNVNNPIYVGVRDGNDTHTIDEISVYGSALSAARWLAHYQAA